MCSNETTLLTYIKNRTVECEHILFLVKIAVPGHSLTLSCLQIQSLKEKQTTSATFQ